MQKITGIDLHAAAPLGAMVHYSDGTARPPERFNKKLSEWKRSNGCGHLVMVRAGDPTRPWSQPTLTIQTEDGAVLVVRMTFNARDPKLFYKVEPRKPGAIMAFSNFGDSIEIQHIWPNLQAAQEWARRGRYVLGKCGHKYLTVLDDGKLAGYTPPES